MDSHHRLKQVRKALGLSQGQLAEKIGRKQGSVSDIERGRNSIDGIVQLLKLTFRVNPDWLREGQGKMFLPYGYRSEEQTSELQSLMRISYADFCSKKTKKTHTL